MLRGKDRPDTSTTTMELSDRWIKSHDLAPPFDQFRNRTVTSDTYYTYDPQMKKFVSVNLDDFGGYGIASSPGWNGNTMVWTDRSALDGSVGTVTITKVSDSEYNWAFKGTDGKGKPQPPGNGSCKKSG
jgi:hypothetical protein